MPLYFPVAFASAGRSNVALPRLAPFSRPKHFHVRRLSLSLSVSSDARGRSSSNAEPASPTPPPSPPPTTTTATALPPSLPSADRPGVQVLFDSHRTYRPGDTVAGLIRLPHDALVGDDAIKRIFVTVRGEMKCTYLAPSRPAPGTDGLGLPTDAVVVSSLDPSSCVHRHLTTRFLDLGWQSVFSSRALLIPPPSSSPNSPADADDERAPPPDTHFDHAWADLPPGETPMQAGRGPGGGGFAQRSNDRLLPFAFTFPDRLPLDSFDLLPPGARPDPSSSHLTVSPPPTFSTVPRPNSPTDDTTHRHDGRSRGKVEMDYRVEVSIMRNPTEAERRRGKKRREERIKIPFVVVSVPVPAAPCPDQLRQARPTQTQARIDATPPFPEKRRHSEAASPSLWPASPSPSSSAVARPSSDVRRGATEVVDKELAQGETIRMEICMPSQPDLSICSSHPHSPFPATSRAVPLTVKTSSSFPFFVSASASPPITVHGRSRVDLLRSTTVHVPILTSADQLKYRAEHAIESDVVVREDVAVLENVVVANGPLSARRASHPAVPLESASARQETEWTGLIVLSDCERERENDHRPPPPTTTTATTTTTLTPSWSAGAVRVEYRLRVRTPFRRHARLGFGLGLGASFSRPSLSFFDNDDDTPLRHSSSSDRDAAAEATDVVTSGTRRTGSGARSQRARSLLKTRDALARAARAVVRPRSRSLSPPPPRPASAFACAGAGAAPQSSPRCASHSPRQQEPHPHPQLQLHQRPAEEEEDERMIEWIEWTSGPVNLLAAPPLVSPASWASWTDVRFGDEEDDDDDDHDDDDDDDDDNDDNNDNNNDSNDDGDDERAEEEEAGAERPPRYTA